MAVKALISTLEDEILDPEEVPHSPLVDARRRHDGSRPLENNTPLRDLSLLPLLPLLPNLPSCLDGPRTGLRHLPLTALLLAPRVSRYVLTDQPYVSRMIHQNLEANPLPKPASSSSSKPSSSRRKKTGAATSSSSSAPGQDSRPDGPGTITFRPLDWELDTPDPSLTGSPAARSFDAVVCCDCIYNEALVGPLVSATADLARLRLGEQRDEADARDSAGAPGDHHRHPSSSTTTTTTDRSEPCVCIVAQQLRSPDVFEEWARAFHRDFRVWRVPDALLPEGLRIESGFVVHIGILREAKADL
ncbi:hypothetical protein ColLi_00885 [Colletotrichum liriopes]|uniref:Diaminohydroxyphosphoribosylamino-pyrimidine deaminase n=1 Tax=Colletotrichum liriopes TaxID=708192 RepID=A0AA37GCI9_9PEZI|nr:hypothetical protein ColLi_00885 [Colletotrichum liriopes]